MKWPNNSLQRTRPSPSGCSPRVPRAGSLSSVSLGASEETFCRALRTATTALPSIVPHLCRFPRALPVAIGIYPAAGYLFLPLHRQ